MAGLPGALLPVSASRILWLSVSLVVNGWAQALPQPASPLEGAPGSRVIIAVQAQQADGKTRTLRMLLDTGAVTCMLDRRAAEGLLLGFPREVQVGGFAPGTRTAHRYSFRSLSLGGVARSQVPVVVMDLERSQRWSDSPVDGFLGMSFLEGTTFTLNPQSRAFHWGVAAPISRWIPLQPPLRDPRPLAKVTWGKGTRELLLDTGAEGTIYGLDLPLDGNCEIAGGLTGVRPIGVGYQDLLLFGESYPGTRVHSGGGQLILGAAFLCAGPTVFDFKEGRLGLSTDAQGALLRSPALSEEAFSPVAWNRRGPAPFLEVAELPTCNRWYRAGFREGDRILKVDSLGGETLNLTRLNALLILGRSLSFTVQRGKNVLQLLSPPETPIRWFRTPATTPATLEPGVHP